MSGWKITITPIPGSEDCIVETSDGGKWVVKGLAIFADGGDGNLFSYYWNSPQSAASGLVRSFAESIRREDPFAVTFYKCILKGLTLITGSEDKKYIDAKDLLRRWEAEDIYKAVKEDPKKFN